MSNTNDFSPWAVADGANVMSPSAFLALTSRQQGAQAGILPSINYNTVLRQATSITAMVAQFIADYGPSNVQDNGNLPVLESQFVAALQDIISIYGGPGLFIGTDTGAANAIQVNNLSPAITSYATNQIFLIKVANGNTTTAPTFQVGSLGALNIVRADGTPCAANDLKAGADVFLAKVGSTVQLVGVYADNSQASVGILFLTSGTFPVPSGIHFIKRVRGWGSGGGGGGASGATQWGSGGGGGAYFEQVNIPVVPGNTYNVYVGVGGSGGVGATDGAQGGDTSFGSYIAGGGLGGIHNGGAGALGGASTIGYIHSDGVHGTVGQIVGGQAGCGVGGVCIFGPGAPPQFFATGTTGQTGFFGRYPGGGGNGACTGTSSGDSQTGGDGGHGLVFLEY